jgi:hypothetical protein
MKFPSHTEDPYDATDSSWVSIRFYFTDDASSRHFMSPQIFPFFFSVLELMHLVLFARFVA